MAGKATKGSGILHALTQAQRLFQQGQLVPTNMAPDNPTLNTALNAAAYLPNAIYGQGVIAPTNDITQNAVNLAQGQQPVPYNQLQSGASKLGYQAGNAINPMQGVPQDLPTAGENAMEGIGPILTALITKSAYKLMSDSVGNARSLAKVYQEAGKTVPNTMPQSSGALQLQHQAVSASPLDQLDRAFTLKDYKTAIPMAQRIMADPAMADYQSSAGLMLRRMVGGGL